MKSWTNGAAGNTGKVAGGGGTRIKPIVTAPAGGKTSSKLATHSGHPPSRK
jgi:hypothetical protein